MRRQTTWRNTAVVVAAAAMALAFSASPAGAQGQAPAAQAPPREKFSVTFVSVKPDMIAEFEHFMTTETNPALIKGGQKVREVWQTATFGDPAQYVIVTQIDNFAMYDSPVAIERALGKDGAQAWRMRAGKFLNSVRVYAVESRPDLSFMGNMTGPPNLAVVTSVHVAMGRNADFENFLKTQLLPLIKQSGIPGYWVNQTMFGGDPNEYVTLALHANYAEIDKGPPASRVIGMEAYQKLLASIPAGTIVSLERSVVKFRADLSILPSEAPK